MASIPLPALDIRPPAAPANPVEQYGQLLALRNQMQNAPLQRQALEQQVQGGQLDLQQKQREMDSQNAIMQAWSTNNGDLGKTVMDAAKSGKVLPGDLAKLQQANFQLQEQAYKMLQEKGNRAVQEGDLYDGAADTVHNAKPEDRPAVYQQQIAGLAKAGVDVSQIPQQYPGDQAFDAMRLGIKSHKAALENAAKQSETDKNNAQAGEAKAQTQKIQQETMWGPTGPAAEAQYRAILQKKAAGQALTPYEQSYAQAFEASNTKNTTQSDTLGVTSNSTNRPAGLATVGRGAPTAPGTVPLLPRVNMPSLNPASPANLKGGLVDLIGQYKTDPATVARLMTKHPDILAQVNAKYPDWDQTGYQAKNKLIQGYTSGTQSKEINAINTAMGHVKTLDDAVDALNNGNVTALNKIGNNLGINLTGQTPAAAFKLIVHRVGPEISSSYIPGGGGEQERFANEKDFDENLPAQTLHNNAGITVKLLRSKVGALENQYKNTVGRDDFNQRFITPEAQAAFQKFSGGGSPSNGNVVRYKIVNGQLVAQ